MSDNELRKIIKHLKHTRARGHDGVTNSMIKQLPCHYIYHLFVIYNSALKLQHCPVICNKAEVVTVTLIREGFEITQNRRLNHPPQQYGDDFRENPVNNIDLEQQIC